MITLGICDDSQEQIDLLLQYVSRYPCGDELRIVQSTQPEIFLGMLKAPCVVFLDIDMGETSGIRLGEKVKALCDDAVIIYITAYEEYALEAFRVRAFHYLVKPVTVEKFHQVLGEALRLIQKSGGAKPSVTFVIQKKGELISLDYGDIIYFEKVGHKICLHAVDRNIEFYGNFIKLLEQLDGNFFFQCHQGYIVNIKKVRGFKDRTLHLEGDRQAPVSRSFVECTKSALAKKLFDGRDER